jgi:lipid II:glycine glycyltransferase (peptidoglycan interpeptide bridge formation enzyme)
MAMNWLTVSDRSFSHVRAHDFIFSDSIRTLVERGIKVYDMGASPEGAQGLKRFKEKWGGKVQIFQVYERSGLLWRVASLLPAWRSHTNRESEEV